MSKVYIAIGGNLGDVKENLVRAVQAVDSLFDTRVTAVSPIYVTDPVGGPEGQPPFLNGAIEVETGLDPAQMISSLMDVERGLGRIREEINGPRTVDLDILLWGDHVQDSDKLTIPHPRMHERSFVLVPLNDIAGDEVHPIFKKTVSELLGELGDPEGIKPLGEEFKPVKNIGQRG